VGISLGLAASMAALRIGAPAGPSSSAVDGWSSRIVADVRVELALGRSLRLFVGPDLGAIVRPVSAAGDDGDRHRVSGLWLGGGLGLTFDPEAP